MALRVQQGRVPLRQVFIFGFSLNNNLNTILKATTSWFYLFFNISRLFSQERSKSLQLGIVDIVLR